MDVAREAVVTEVTRRAGVTDVTRGAVMTDVMRKAGVTNVARGAVVTGHPVTGPNALNERATITASSGAWPGHTVMACAGRPSTTLLRSALQVVDSASAPAMTGRPPCSTPGLAVTLAGSFIALLIVTGRRPPAAGERPPPALVRRPLLCPFVVKNRGLAACIDLSDGPPPDRQGVLCNNCDFNHEDTKFTTGGRPRGAAGGYGQRHGGRRALPADRPTGLKANPNNHPAVWCMTSPHRHGLHTQAIRDFPSTAALSDRWRPLAPHNPRISVLYSGRRGKDRASPRQMPATHRRPRHMKERRDG